MGEKSTDLHGSAPDECRAALLIIDMINDFHFTDGEMLFVKTLPVANNILELKKRAKASGIPVIYVNDNFGKWKSNFNVLVEHCINDNTLGKPIAETLQPDEDDYFVLKPKHSGFYSTTLELLLNNLQTEVLILTGVTTDMCIMFTANDAYMRDYKIIIPSDCTAASKEEDHITTLKILQKIVNADVRPSGELNLKEIL